MRDGRKINIVLRVGQVGDVHNKKDSSVIAKMLSDAGQNQNYVTLSCLNVRIAASCPVCSVSGKIPFHVCNSWLLIFLKLAPYPKHSATQYSDRNWIFPIAFNVHGHIGFRIFILRRYIDQFD